MFIWCQVTQRAIRAAELPDHLERAARTLPAPPEPINPDGEKDLLVCLASEVLERSDFRLPGWIGPDTHYLVLTDIPEPALLRLPGILRLHRPDRRMHASRDPGAIQRQLVALHRDQAWEGIVDAYVLKDTLVTVLGDFSVRDFPVDRLPGVKHLDPAERANFEIDSAGSFLYWKSADLHVGPSQMLQAVDPAYLAEVEIERYRIEKVSRALRQMRTERGLRQSDISGLSTRHVGRLEREENRLTVDAARCYARTFDQTLDEFLEELAHVLSAERDPGVRLTREEILAHRDAGRA